MYYRGLKQPQIFLGISNIDEEVFNESRQQTEKHEPDESYKKDLETIQKFMDSHRIYTQPELSIDELANQLKMHPRRLSYLINTFLGMNFMSYINNFRIEFAKKRLLEPRDKGETIIEVMYAVGFNSKSTFNTLFKKETGFTPSEYKRKHLKQ